MRKAYLPLGIVAVMISIPLIGYLGESVTAADDGNSAQPRMSDLAWLAGDWVKEDGKSRLQELWSKPDGDSMAGVFRWIKKGKVWIYELMTIREEEGTLVFRFRHFGNDMTAWEPKTEPITYRLLSFGDREVIFENPEDEKHYRYELSRPDDKTLLVRVGAKRGEKVAYSEFRYTLR